MVHHPKYSSAAALLFLIGLFSNTAVAQSVTIRLNGTNRTVLEATAPVNVGYRFQASADYENWEDIGDQASGVSTYRIDAQDQKRFFRLRAWSTQDAPITVVLIGDSTVADFVSNSERFYGWGQSFSGYLKPNVRVVNLGLPFQSSKTFISSIEKDHLLAIKPEFVLAQFGMVDAWDLEGIKTTIPEYEANLRTIIQMIRDFKGTPVLVTPPVWRVFDPENRIYPWLVDRCEVVRKLSVELQTYLIDLNQSSMDLFNELGPTASAYITWSEEDWAHFTLAGSEVIAGLVVDDLPGILRSQVLASAGGVKSARLESFGISALLKRPEVLGH